VTISALSWHDANNTYLRNMSLEIQVCLHNMDIVEDEITYSDRTIRLKEKKKHFRQNASSSFFVTGLFVKSQLLLALCVC
jgi:hypothetical protein